MLYVLCYNCSHIMTSAGLQMTLADVEIFITNHSITTEGEEAFPLNLLPVDRSHLHSSSSKARAQGSRDSQGKCGGTEEFPLLPPHSVYHLNSNNLVNLFLSSLPDNLRVLLILGGREGHHQWGNNSEEEEDRGGQ